MPHGRLRISGQVYRVFNAAVFDRLLVRDGQITEVRYRAPFGAIFGTEKFEQRSLVGGIAFKPIMVSPSGNFIQQ